MAKPNYIFVVAAEGREVPIPRNQASAAGARLLICKPGEVHRLPYGSFVRRRLASGDLRLTDRTGKPVNELAAAVAPDVELEATLESGEPSAAFGELPPIAGEVTARIALPSSSNPGGK